MGVLARKLMDLGSKRWAFVGSSASSATAASGNLTLTEPSGVVQGDLLVACIAYRSNAAFSSPGSPWVSIASQNLGDATNVISSIASGHMFYCIRGASAPGLVFTRTGGDVAMGRIVAYRNNVQDSSVLVTSVSETDIQTNSVVIPGLTTQNPRDLIVAAFCRARSGTGSNFTAATNPSGSSGTNSGQTADPIEGTWQERFDTSTTTGADTSLSVYDAIRASAGATGDLSASASQIGRHVIIAAAFKELSA